ncbi:carbohydrate ABC transporter permease [Kushneria phosphatilytica]|uniref:Carbohydrate ABC transporter permease n=1 Tax=Kushneria phosphatilytica TaxID=657387 RepID=A0A1S1NRZ1_9GAMM|nr:carbohydrate ABC transporter permease [Kushneria phosphatilytica]OHV07699.1 sugar ABC transporter permease [Kushneria phosphatilytica]QEL10195.1 carbohydrate ABC transporter permease [Kushneria phosphatilytica]
MNAQRSNIGLTVVGWVVALIMFFPILWMVLTAFKTEQTAFTTTPEFFFSPTLESFRTALAQGAGYWHYAFNSFFTAAVSTLLGLVLAVPAAFAMAFYPSKRTDFTLVWMVSTKFIPAVGVLIPIFLIYKSLGLIDNDWGLIMLFTAMNLPIMVWMVYSYFRDVPKDIVEAADIDGASTMQTMFRVILPLALPGLASTGLLALILAWNESFWSLTMTDHDAATLAVFIASFKSAEGLFWAKMSAASVLTVTPIVVLGWFAQRQMVRGLTFGAVK